MKPLFELDLCKYDKVEGSNDYLTLLAMKEINRELYRNKFVLHIVISGSKFNSIIAERISETLKQRSSVHSGISFLIKQ